MIKSDVVVGWLTFNQLWQSDNNNKNKQYACVVRVLFSLLDLHCIGNLTPLEELYVHFADTQELLDLPRAFRNLSNLQVLQVKSSTLWAPCFT
jgi:hypothetical protein